MTPLCCERYCGMILRNAPACVGQSAVGDKPITVVVFVAKVPRLGGNANRHESFDTFAVSSRVSRFPMYFYG